MALVSRNSRFEYLDIFADYYNIKSACNFLGFEGEIKHVVSQKVTSFERPIVPDKWFVVLELQIGLQMIDENLYGEPLKDIFQIEKF